MKTQQDLKVWLSSRKGAGLKITLASSESWMAGGRQLLSVSLGIISPVCQWLFLSAAGSAAVSLSSRSGYMIFLSS